MKNLTEVPEGLSRTAAGRDNINTGEFGIVIDKAGQTIRKQHCLNGEAYGIKPIKVGNRLLWPVTEIAKLLKGGE